MFSRGVLNDTPVFLNDVNPELVNFYSVLRDDCEPLIEKLEEHAKRHGKDYYYSTRAKKQRQMKQELMR